MAATFLGLPIELRKHIYAFCFDPKDEDYAGLWEDDEDGVVTVLEPALTRTCKSVRTESLPIFYGLATFDTRTNLYQIFDPSHVVSLWRWYRLFPEHKMVYFRTFEATFALSDYGMANSGELVFLIKLYEADGTVSIEHTKGPYCRHIPVIREHLEKSLAFSIRKRGIGGFIVDDADRFAEIDPRNIDGPPTVPWPASFLGLPIELRERIYDFSFQPKDGEYAGLWRDDQCEEQIFATIEEPALTQVSKTIRAESLPLFYGSARFLETLTSVGEMDETWYWLRTYWLRTLPWYRQLSDSRMGLVRKLVLTFATDHPKRVTYTIKLYMASNSFTIDEEFNKEWLRNVERHGDPYDDKEMQTVRQHLLSSLERSIRERGVGKFTAFDIERLVTVDPETHHDEPTDLQWMEDEELSDAIIRFRSPTRP
ncbi:hypothetical protein LTR97_008989 [Elasticomyces elasticus]|uniref:Uncharacterized protein n=1 Tax=Elasticomyces elasticus TaxID=574655 RepID=A0AAN7VNT0_9PEZI|nr:hypothetical protein LTR97_008989 [Elasticomyces elasticus]